MAPAMRCADLLYTNRNQIGTVTRYDDLAGTTKIGVWKDGFWCLNNTGTGSYQSGGDFFYSFGGPGQVPVVGDWNGDGRTKIGFYVGGFWAADYNGNGRWDGTGVGADRFSAFGGNPGEQPLQAKW